MYASSSRISFKGNDARLPKLEARDLPSPFLLALGERRDWRDTSVATPMDFLPPNGSPHQFDKSPGVNKRIDKTFSFMIDSFCGDRIYLESLSAGFD